MSGLTVQNKDRCTVTHPYSTIDLKGLARYMFGAGRFHADEFGQFTSGSKTVRIVKSGTDGASWIVGDKVLKDTNDFKNLMKPLPLATPTFSGDVFLAINVYGEQQFLIIPFKSQDLQWFRNIEELKEYYENTPVRPAYKILSKGYRGPSILRSTSDVDEEEELDEE